MRRGEEGDGMRMEILALKSADEWSVMDLYRVLHELSILYNRLYVLTVYKDMGYNKLIRALWYSSAHVENGGELAVHRIRVGSPAEFNLKGIGEIVREVRELVKDLTYRNRQEEEIGEIEVVRRKVQTLREAGFSNEKIREIIGTLANPAVRLQKQLAKNRVEISQAREDDEGKHS